MQETVRGRDGRGGRKCFGLKIIASSASTFPKAASCTRFHNLWSGHILSCVRSKGGILAGVINSGTILSFFVETCSFA